MKKNIIVLLTMLLTAKLIAKESVDGMVAVFSYESTQGQLLIVNTTENNIEIRSISCSFSNLAGDHKSGSGASQNVWHEVPFILKAKATVCVAILPAKANEIKLEIDTGIKPLPLVVTRVDSSRPWINLMKP